MTDSENTYQPDFLPEFEAVQRTLDKFVDINYKAAQDAYYDHSQRRDRIDIERNIGIIRQQLIELLAANPPMATIPKSYDTANKDYLWYSDFYDYVTKDVYRQYGKFTAPAAVITPANYATELARIDLPYFKEIVRLVGLLRLIEYVSSQLEPIEPESFDPGKMNLDTLSSPTKSYSPKMTDEQLGILADGINTLDLFKHKVNTRQLHDLFLGKKQRLFFVTNQKTYVYLLDRLADDGYIVKTWNAVAGFNCDFASVQPAWMARRNEGQIHYITAQQFRNNRKKNKREAIKGINTIDEILERMAELDVANSPAGRP